MAMQFSVGVLALCLCVSMVNMTKSDIAGDDETHAWLAQKAAAIEDEVRRSRLLRPDALSAYEDLASELLEIRPNLKIATVADLARQDNAVATVALAWTMLANMSHEADARNMILLHAMRGDRSALAALSLMPPPVSRNLASKVALESEDRRAREATVALLAHVGDQQTIDLLNRIAVTDKDAMLRDAAKRAARHLGEKLQLNAHDREQWEEYGAFYWRVKREVIVPAYMGGDIDNAAEYLHLHRRRAPVEFIRSRIGERDPVAITMAGLQREATLMNDLAEIARDEAVIPRQLAIISIVRIGGNSAVERIRALIAPENVPGNKEITRVLAKYGDEEFVRLLRELLANRQYEQLWPDLTDALEHIQLRSEPDDHTRTSDEDVTFDYEVSERGRPPVERGEAQTVCRILFFR